MIPASRLVDGVARRVPPPETPVQARPDAPAQLDDAWPADAHALLARYGAGTMSGTIRLLTPWGPASSFAEELAERAHDRSLRALDPGAVPDALYPEPGGLLVWGQAPDDVRLCWRTEGTPDRWTTVIWDRTDGTVEDHPMGAVTLLGAWLDGVLRSALLAPRPAAAAPWFDPERPGVRHTLTLSPARGSFAARVRALQRALAPTSGRGGETEDGETTLRFAARDDWRVQYRDGDDEHQLRADVPARAGGSAVGVLVEAARALGGTILEHQSSTHDGRVRLRSPRPARPLWDDEPWP